MGEVRTFEKQISSNSQLKRNARTEESMTSTARTAIIERLNANPKPARMEGTEGFRALELHVDIVCLFNFNNPFGQ